jgi:hypothetical protein
MFSYYSAAVALSMMTPESRLSRTPSPDPFMLETTTLLVVEYESLVVDFVLYFYIVKVQTRRLEGL